MTLSSIHPESSALHPHEVEASTPQDLLALVNEFRRTQGIGPLVLNVALSNAAQAYATVLATQAEFSHTVGGTTATGRDQAAGYPGGYIGENIARGFFDAATVEAAWEASPGHRANLVNPNFTDIGIGIANGPYGMSWVQDFGKQDATNPQPAPAPQPAPQPAPPAQPIVSKIGVYTVYTDTAKNYYLLPGAL